MALALVAGLAAGAGDGLSSGARLEPPLPPLAGPASAGGQIVFLGSTPAAAGIVLVMDCSGRCTQDLSLRFSVTSARSVYGSLLIELLDATGARCAFDAIPGRNFAAGVAVAVESRFLSVGSESCGTGNGASRQASRRLRAVLVEAGPGGRRVTAAEFPVGWRFVRPAPPRSAASLAHEERALR